MSDTFRSMRVMVLVLIAIVGVWMALPSVASAVLERWFERQGYENVMVRLGRPGLRSMTVPTIALTQRLTGEIVTLSLNNSQVKYTLLGLLAGHIDLLVLPDLSIEIRMAQVGTDGVQPPPDKAAPDVPDSLLNVLTASDLVQRLPLLPCDEVHIDHVKVFREQATGPLQTVVMTGTIKQQRSALVAELLLQGVDTIPYELRMTGDSATDMSLQLRAAQPNAAPIVLWRSESVRKETQVQLKGVVEVNVQELAPFLALAVPLGLEWQRVNGSVTVNWVGTAASDAPIASLWKDAGTEVHATVQLTTALPELKGYGRDIAVKATGTLSGNAQLAHWAIAPGTLATATVNARTMPALSAFHDLLLSESVPVVVESAQDIKGELFWTEFPPRFTASGLVTASYGSPRGPVHVEIAGRQLSGQGRTIDHAEAQVLIKGTLPAVLSEPLGITQAAGNVRADVTLKGTALRGTIKPASAATFVRFRQDPVVVAQAVFQLVEPLPVEFDTMTGRWTAGQAMIAWQTPQIQLAGSQATMQQAAIKLDGAEGSGKAWDARATATIKGLTLIQPSSLPIDFTVHVNADSLNVKADIHAQSQDKSVALAAHLEQARASGRGALQGTFGPVRFDPSMFRLRQLLSPWPYPLDVTEGNVSGTFDAAWAPNAEHHIQIKAGTAEIVIERLVGQYREIELSGLDTKLNVVVEGLERIATSRPAEIKIASVNTGVEIINIAMTVQGEWDLREKLPLVEVRDFRCELLGGVATSQGVRADLAYPPYAFTVLVRQVDLSKVLSLEQQKGLQGTGLLDGSIPITVTARGLTVKDGYFEARPPGGVIQYAASPEAAKAVTQANANMQLVLQALNNFQYNVLQIGAQYVEEGTLQLKTRLEGKNPDQKRSPPIHFNLAVQENIPTLLKSLRLMGDIEESVQKKFVKP
ncbi:MAG TPA: YdbH domain-containing protein [Nitrospira sp.]|nr:YdbH domain-containing protein [Nitrospira sp.]